MRSLRSLILAAATAACFCTPVHAADSGPAADVAGIRQVVQQFQAAIIAHDGKTLGSLFLQEHGSWLEVFDTATYEDVKKRHPDAKKVMHSSWKEFADDIQKSTKAVEERFYNVRIDTNGAVGSVYFDFDFIQDGKVSNRGSETWQMVRAEDGWKIGSMLFSIGR
ncbi:nuclear transport factor 2 family protein [Herbaspirillum sp. SJZ107]|uniref:nuclear transport factor 2 family protein n=1 Tax=Herbaspirillum sp. SJZ107 TaxID=2572881 RepID=UPI00114E1644|nr:nuclear transport factor 2 family protein [Herbaspirillum sp. SJZ107]TQK02718.1 uncharacterized protein DUF4440 [Herbaspirillum sp. SJZ107]